jgi:hypothetical protein
LTRRRTYRGSAALAAGLFVAVAARADDEQRLAEVRQARSVAAEAAATLDLRSQGRVTAIYTDQMGADAREELRDLARRARSDAPAAAPLIDSALDALARHDAGALRAIAARLLAMEGRRAQAD